MKKLLFLAIIILGLSSCVEYPKPINEVKMDVAEQKFVQDTTSFDSYVKIADGSCYFYTLDNKELYAKINMSNTIEAHAYLNLLAGILIGLLIGALLVFLS